MIKKMSPALGTLIPDKQLRANQYTGIKKKEKGKRNNCMVDRLKIIHSVHGRKHKIVIFNQIDSYLFLMVTLFTHLPAI